MDYRSVDYQPVDRPPAPAPPRPGRRRRLPAIAGVILLIIVVGLVLWRMHGGNPPSGPSSPGEPNRNSQTSSRSPDIRLIATGDFIAHDSLNQQAKQANGNYDYLRFMSDFKPVFNAADIRFCNQATVSGGQAFGISGYPVFNAPTQFAKDMAGLGCNLVNTASNHSFDKGQAAIDATLDVWKNQPGMLAVAGENSSPAERDTIRYFTVKGVKFAFLAYTTYNNNTPPNDYGVTQYSEAYAAGQIGAARAAGAKFIIVSMRWGTEYSPSINSEQKTESQFLADHGVNLILGHGPHELEPVKWLDGSNGGKTLVWYSLGNFINTQEPAETLFNGLAVMNIDNKTYRIKNVGYLPIYMHYEWTAAQSASEDLPARHNLHLYLLDDVTQAMIDANQLHTTVAAQRQRLQGLLNTYTDIPVLTKQQYYQ
jgi:poly-gamma-glutamate synthesis protein (capsule biosynthesis protein)